MNTKSKLCLAMVVLATFPLSALAAQYRIVDQPRQECWNEQVATQTRGNDYGPALLGGVAGGLLGSRVGGGNGRNAATAIGAVTGALTGDRLYGGQGGVSYQNVQRCRTVVDHVKVALPEPQVYYAPAPVVVEQEYYVLQQPQYRRDWRAERARREQWRHEEWERRHEHERRHHERHEDDDD